MTTVPAPLTLAANPSCKQIRPMPIPFSTTGERPRRGDTTQDEGSGREGPLQPPSQATTRFARRNIAGFGGSGGDFSIEILFSAPQTPLPRPVDEGLAGPAHEHPQSGSHPHP